MGEGQEQGDAVRGKGEGGGVRRGRVGRGKEEREGEGEGIFVSLLHNGMYLLFCTIDSMFVNWLCM